MKNKNNYWLIAGVINTLTAILHTVGGQIDLISPLLNSEVDSQIKTELLGVWHMGTIILWSTSLVFFQCGFNIKEKNHQLIPFLSYLYLLFSGAFVFSSLFSSVLAPQWIVLLPIGILGILGMKKLEVKPNKI